MTTGRGKSRNRDPALVDESYKTPDCGDGFVEIYNQYVADELRAFGCKIKNGLGGVLPGYWACRKHHNLYLAETNLKRWR